MLETSSPRAAASQAAREGGSKKAAVISTAVVVAVLVVLNVLDNFSHVGLFVAPAAAALLLGFARYKGLTWKQLGLSRDRLRAGGWWAAIAISVVAGVYLAGVLIPATRPAFLDARYHFGVEGALLSALVIIPVGTVLLEEVAFRSVLWGMLSRHMATWRVLLTTSALFGLWHILPSLHLAPANAAVGGAVQGAGTAGNALVVLGTVAFTAVGGLVAGELRRRSGSILASAGMHWATNALGVLFGLMAWKIMA